MISNQCFIINKTTLQEALKLLCIPSLLSYSCILVCLRKPFQNSFFFIHGNKTWLPSDKYLFGAYKDFKGRLDTRSKGIVFFKNWSKMNFRKMKIPFISLLSFLT